jgi:hypothetical protein
MPLALFAFSFFQIWSCIVPRASLDQTLSIYASLVAGMVDVHNHTQQFSDQDGVLLIFAWTCLEL